MENSTKSHKPVEIGDLRAFWRFRGVERLEVRIGAAEAVTGR